VIERKAGDAFARAVLQAIRRLGFALLVGSAIGCIGWMAAQAWLRSPEYAEACVLFNASRLRDGLALYVDPRIGAQEYGLPPARYFVAYTPIYSALVAVLPSASALPVARLLGGATWLGGLAFHSLRARPELRRQAWVAALFAASALVLARWAGCAKGDTIALCLAGLAFGRALDRGRADVLTGALFGAAFLVKPSVVGMGLGALTASLLAGHFSGDRPSPRRNPVLAVIAAAGVVATFLATLELGSGGVATQHLRAALGLSFRTELFVGNLIARGPLVVGPIAAATLAAWRARSSDSGRIALAAVATSTVAAFLGMAKVGGSSAYLLEPVLATVVVLARFPAGDGEDLLGWLRLRGRAAVGFAIATSMVVSLTATTRGLFDDASALPARRRSLDLARRECVGVDGAVVLSSDPGIELALNGRIHTHPIEMENEVRRGRFPVATWVEDVGSPTVRCVVTWTGDRPAPPSPAGPFPPEVAHALGARFELARVDAGYAIYRARSR